ncbi:MAG TPA: CapA family protein [Candidatus Dormibacteraeota bacterium]|nr:CapA family protein [Candidatus Dormibacteraeota bacterium]
MTTPRNRRIHLNFAGTPVLLIAVILAACNSTATVPGASPSPVTEAAATLVAPPNYADQPSYSDRTGRLPVLSLQNLFHPRYIPSSDPNRVRTLLVTGDVIPARGVNYFATQRHDFLWPFRPTADYARNADVTYVNLETPLFAGCPVDPNSGFTFCGDARFVDGLTLMGAKVVNLANNHTSNYGAQGIVWTQQLLNSHGMQISGLGPVAVIDVRGIKFGFIGFNGVGRAIDREAVRQGIAHARQLADIVVVQFHWGKEYERQPMPDPHVPTPDDPVEIGHLAIDWGADIVIGNHPHWYQGVEIYHGKLITYAHGNFVFDQMWSEETREGVIGTYTFYGTQLVAATWKAYRIYDYGQPVFMNAKDSSAVLQTMEAASDQLAQRLNEPTTKPIPAMPPSPVVAPIKAP